MADAYTPATAPADPENLDQEYLRSCATLDDERAKDYHTFDQYYDGDQRTYLTDRARKYLEVSQFPYNENFCETVVDALVERCSIVGVESEDELVSDWLWSVWWKKNNGAALSIDVHTESAKKGDAYVVLDWDGELVRGHFNRPDIIRPFYVDGELTKVAKVWNSRAVSPTNPSGIEVSRLNLYYPDRVEKYYTLTSDSGERGASLWAPHVDRDDEPWPTPWTDARGEALGIPVFHFANKPRTDRMGRSELRGVIPQQDRLNKELLDLSYVLDQMGWPQRYATGIGDSSSLKSVPGEVWTADSTEAGFGQFDAADPSGLLRAISATMMRMALRSSTPAFRIMLEGGYPSGEALKTGEASLVAKAKTRHVQWGTTWGRLFYAVIEAQLAFAQGTGSMPVLSDEELDEYSISPLWSDPESRNEKEHLETLGLMSGLGVSNDTLMSMMPGIDPAAERRKKEEEAREALRATQTMLDNGVLPPAPPMPGRSPQLLRR